MIDSRIERQYRRFLLILSGVIFAGSIAELILVEHHTEFLQFIPFVLCGLGILSILTVSYAPSAATIRGHRILMWVILSGGLVGVYLHLVRNFDFHMEIQPNSTTGEAFLEALYGSIPLLAPGIIPVAALLALAAVWHHPLLATRDESAE